MRKFNYEVSLMNSVLQKKEYIADLCVIGGGLAGSFAALSAARHGAKVVLMQDRPVLGGNASSEIRVWVRGAKGIYDRESGLISELEEKNIATNPTLVPSIFDTNLFDLLNREENITLILNCSCLDADSKNGKILSVTGWQLTTYTYITVKAKYFADCSGDSILAPLVNAEYKHGRESSKLNHESLAPDKEDSMTMGLSVLLAARETDHPVKFTPPSFANIYPDDECFSNGTAIGKHFETRDHTIATSGNNLWWIELGGDMHSIYDTEKVRTELLATLYGVWDHLKNQGDHGLDNWDIDYVDFLPGKRESRRYVGDYQLNENDIKNDVVFVDEIASGGWPLDDHNPHGIKKVDGYNAPSICIPVNVYGIPYRSLYSHNIDNLFFAGRNISVTHCALSSTRVMATCSMLGQAVGTAASIAIKNGCLPRDIYNYHIKTLQKTLQDDGVWLPHYKYEYNGELLKAKCNLNSEQIEVLFNGIERPRTEDGQNEIFQKVGDTLRFEFSKPVKIKELRLRFDPDFGHKSVSPNTKMRVFTLKLHTGKDFEQVKVAETIVKDFIIYSNDKEVANIKDNYVSNFKIALNIETSKLEIKWISTHGAEKVGIFGIDIL